MPVAHLAGLAHQLVKGHTVSTLPDPAGVTNVTYRKR